MADTYDVLVIGGRPAGEHAAGRLADSGLRVAVVERELVGGECSYWGCIPSKTPIRPGDVLAAVRRAPGAARAVTGRLDVPAAFAQRDYMTSGWRDDGRARWLESKGITLIRGTGRLTGERTIEVQAGDCNGLAALTHMGKYHGRIAAAAILGQDVANAASREVVPRVTFTDPQVCAVGRAAAEARAAGLQVMVVSTPTGEVPGAYTQGNGIRSTSHLVIDDQRRTIAGATFTGPGLQETAPLGHRYHLRRRDCGPTAACGAFIPDG